MDETGIRLFQVAGAGNVVVTTVRLRGNGLRPVQNMSKHQERASFTHVVMVCDDAAMQPLLPQVLIFNKHMLPQQESDLIQPILPTNVYMLRQKTGWMNEDSMKQILKLLHASLLPSLGNRQVILSCDAYRAHMTTPVIRLSYKLGIYLWFIPAKMTWALQPCDTHVLAVYKRQLRIEFQMKQIQNKLGTVSIRETVECTCRAIKSVLDTRSWSKSFMDTGVGSSQKMLSKSLLQVLHWKEPPPMSSDLPTLSQLMLIFPSSAEIPVEALFGIFRQPGIPGTDRLETTVPEMETHLMPSNSWLGRTRSSSSATNQGTAPVVEPCPPAARPLLQDWSPWQTRPLRMARLPPRLPAALLAVQPHSQEASARTSRSPSVEASTASKKSKHG